MNKLINKTKSSWELSVFAVGVLAYITAICTLPSSGVWTSLPVAFAMSYLATYVCTSRVLIYAIMTILPMVLNLLYGFEVRHGIVAAAYGIVSSFFAVLAKRAVYTAKVSKKKRNADIYVKSISVLLVSVTAGVAVWLVCFGNPVSALVAKYNNSKYVSDNYSDAVTCEYTFHSFGEGYLTKIDFEQAENGKIYYVSEKSRDDYYLFSTERLYAEAKDYFESKTTIDADGVESYIDGKTLGITPESDYREYLDEFEYLVHIPEIVTDIYSFKAVYENVSDFTDMSDTFRYKSITVCADDFQGNKYYAHKEHGTEPVFVFKNEEFNKTISEKF